MAVWPFLPDARPTKGWLRAAREALGVTQSQMAMRLGMRQQPHAQVESRERLDKVTLETIRRAAAALDCDLVYALVPRASVATSFSGLAQKHDPGLAVRRATQHSMALEGQGRRESAEEPAEPQARLTIPGIAGFKARSV